MKMDHGLKMLLLSLNFMRLFVLSFFILFSVSYAKTLKVDTLTPSAINGDLVLQRNGTGEITFGDYSGFCKFATGSPTCSSTIDLTSDVSGILPIANGGTGSSTQNFVDLTTAQTVAGVKTFSDQIIGSSGLDLEGTTTINNNGSGNLVTITQDNNGNALTIDQNGSGNALEVSGQMVIDNDITMNGTGALKLPVGTDLQRPTPETGHIRFNSDDTTFEGYDGSSWNSIGSSPTTTIGDIIYNNTGTAGGDTRLPIGTNDQLLTVVSGEPAWADAPVSTTLTTKGDIQTFDTANARLPVGTDGQFLVADDGETTGLKWSDQLQGKLNPITDWTEISTDVGDLLTATTTNPTYGTVSSNTARWRRVGSEMELEWDFYQSAPGTSGSGAYLINLPTGYTIDTSVKPVNTNIDVTDSTIEQESSVGTMHLNFMDSGGGGSKGTASVVPYSSTQLKAVLQFTADDGVSDMRLWGDSGFTLGGSGSKVSWSVKASIPIQGWSSGLDSVVRNNQAIKVIARGAASTALTDQVSNVPFREVEDNLGVWNGTEFTMPSGKSKIITFSGGIRLNANVSFFTAVYVDTGSGYNFFNNCSNRNNSEDINKFQCSVKLNSGDKAAIRIVANNGTTATDNAIQDTFHTLTITENLDSEFILGTFDSMRQECQTKFLSTDITSDTNPVTDLTFNNLTVGKKYRICTTADAFTSTATADNLSLNSINNGVAVNLVTCSFSNSSNNLVDRKQSCSEFTAAATTLTHQAVSITTNNSFRGSGDKSRTYATLCELPDNTILNSTKFN